MRHYHHLTYSQRCHIHVLKSNEFSLRQIAQQLGVSPSTISREIRRNQCVTPILQRLIQDGVVA